MHGTASPIVDRSQQLIGHAAIETDDVPTPRAATVPHGGKPLLEVMDREESASRPGSEMSNRDYGIDL